MDHMSEGLSSSPIPAESHEMPFNIDGHGTYCNESAYADDYVALYNGPTTDNPLAPDSRNDQLSPFHCGLYDEDPDFKLPGFKSTESSGKGVCGRPSAIS